MRKLNYTEVVQTSDHVGQVVNQLGDTIMFWENHDISITVIATSERHKRAVVTEFFETDDFFEGSDYNPIFIGDKVGSAFDMLDWDKELLDWVVPNKV